MSNAIKNTGKATPKKSALDNSILKPFSFHAVPYEHPAHGYAETLENVMAITAGIALALEIKESNDVERAHIADSDNPENEIAPILNMHQENVLMRFALVSARMLHDKSERDLWRLNERMAVDYDE